MKTKFLCLILALLLLAACSVPAEQEPGVSDASSAPSTGTSEIKQIVTLGDQEIPLSAAFLELMWSSDTVHVCWEAGDGSSGEGSSPPEAVDISGISELSGVNRMVVCFTTSLDEDTQAGLFRAMAQLPNLESIALQGSTASLEALGDCAALQDLHLVECDAASLPTLDLCSLYLTHCTGVDWSRIGAFPALQALGIFGEGKPASLSPLAESPTLQTLYIDFTRDDLVDGSTFESPIIFQGTEVELPAYVELPYSKEDILLFTAGDAARRIVFELDSFS